MSCSHLAGFMLSQCITWEIYTSSRQTFTAPSSKALNRDRVEVVVEKQPQFTKPASHTPHGPGDGQAMHWNIFSAVEAQDNL